MPRFPLTAAPALILTLSLALASPAAAFDEADRAAINARVATFEQGVANKNYAVFFSAVPPKITAKLAALSGKSVAEIDAMMKAKVAEAMAQVTMEKFTLATDQMETGETATGRAYAKIPTSAVMSVPKMGKYRSSNTTLALKDEGKWYLLRIDSPQQIALLTQVYPDFKGIDFPKGTMEAVD